ncbi:hypothetical protein R3P38DRAFT_3198776 [Favolaschia claudopus]|uniref:Uncharacterized protein n=1 Tax=Favolaschia claudopus TaxID=2862362 RepID=A0AAW0B2V4_9AGAR
MDRAADAPKVAPTPAEVPTAAAAAAFDSAAKSTGAAPATDASMNGPADEESPVMKRALTYDVECSSTIAGLPPVQKGRLVHGWRRRHLEQEHPERASVNDDADDEVHARAAMSYDISCYCLKNSYDEALFQAEQRAREWDYHTDSDDDSIVCDDGPQLQDIIIWDGTQPEKVAQMTDAGVVADEAIAKALDKDSVEDARDGKACAIRAMTSCADKSYFGFVPASLLAAAAADDDDEESGSLYGVERSPIPSLMSEPSSPTDLDLGERMQDVQYQGKSAASTNAEDAKGASSAAGDADAPAPRPKHEVELVRINGVRKVLCGCEDGKHLGLRTRSTFAFEAGDGTVIVKKFRTMIVALN